MRTVLAALAALWVVGCNGWQFMEVIATREGDSETFNKLLEVNNSVWGFDVKGGVVRHIITTDVSNLRIGKGVEMVDPLTGFIDGELLYVADSEGGLKILNIAKNTAPRMVGALKLRKSEGRATAVAAANGFVFLFLHSSPVSSLSIINATDPSSPTVISKVNVNGIVYAAEASGQLLHAVSTANVILTYNISNPKLFKYKSSVPTGSLQPTSLTSFKEFIYAGVGSEVRAYLTSNPDIVEEALRLDVGAPVNDVLWYRGYLYAATDKGLAVIDVRDPRKGRLTAMRTTQGRARSLTVVEFRVHVLDDEGVTIVNGLPSTDAYWNLPQPETTMRELVIGGPDTETAVAVEGTEEEMPVRTDEPDPKPVPTADSLPEISITQSGGAATEVIGRAASLKQLWAGHPGSRLTNVPSFLRNATVHRPAETLAPGAELTFACKYATCDFYVLTQHCLPCSHHTNGGIPHLVLNLGWVPLRCAPGFQGGGDGSDGSGHNRHQLAAFYKRLYKGEIESLPPLSKRATYTVFATVESCRQHANIDLCRSAGEECVWQDDLSGCVPSPPVCYGRRPDIDRHNRCSCFD